MDNNFMQTLGNYGWICPVCKRVLSPWTPECPCRGQVDWTSTTATSNSNKTITLTEDIKKDLKDLGLSQQEITYYKAMNNSNHIGD